MQSSADNHGWIVIAAGSGGTTTAKRYASREFANAAQRPVLSVTYELAPVSAVPLPLWANVALALTLTGAMVARRKRRLQAAPRFSSN
jgi:hypothetical protein